MHYTKNNIYHHNLRKPPNVRSRPTVSSGNGGGFEWVVILPVITIPLGGGCCIQ